MTRRGASTAPFPACVNRNTTKAANLAEISLKREIALKSAIYFNSHAITRIGVGAGRHTPVQLHYRHVNAGKWASLNVRADNATPWIYSTRRLIITKLKVMWLSTVDLVNTQLYTHVRRWRTVRPSACFSCYGCVRDVTRRTYHIGLEGGCSVNEPIQKKVLPNFLRKNAAF